jgi:hypothetical protein
MADKKVINTDVIDSNGRTTQIITFDDGSQSRVDLGPTSGQINAVQSLQATFEQFGLGSLASSITKLVQKGTPAESILLMMQSPEAAVDPDAKELYDAYQKRFAANAERRNKGLPVLSPAEYLSTERAYRAIMADAGMPTGFYDSQDDFQKFLANDTSPTAVKARVDAAAQAVNNADPAYKKALTELYGIDEATMAANMLDPERALPFIQKQAKAVEFGAAAARQGLQVTNIGEQFGSGATNTGYSAEQGYAAIAGMLPQTQALANIYGQEYNQQTAEAEVFNVGEGLASAKRKRQKLGELETSTFSGQSGLAAGSLKKNAAGSF